MAETTMDTVRVRQLLREMVKLAADAEALAPAGSDLRTHLAAIRELLTAELLILDVAPSVRFPQAGRAY